jgi:hypothetical protein
VHGSRVTLDTIVHRYQVGDTLEDIHDGFPTVSLAQINAIINWYFNNRAEADVYLEEREAEGERIRQEIESTPEYQAWRAELHRRIAELRKT